MTETYHWWQTDQFAAVALLVGGIVTGALLLIVLNWILGAWGGFMQALSTIDINLTLVLTVAFGTFLTAQVASRR